DPLHVTPYLAKIDEGCFSAVYIDMISQFPCNSRNVPTPRASLLQLNLLIVVDFFYFFANDNGCCARTETRFHTEDEISSQPGNVAISTPLKQ
ncbi:MAG TPA: hypothetical protein VK187_04185, partial [Geobacteraceae bacterium]|nr:hypothetical protein [Geobacteraceae bacterium]